MFSTEDNQAHGISAVKALQLAAAEGQKIWTITRTSLDIALNGLQLPASIETDIRNSVYAGKEVTAHEKPVSFFGKSSVGYTVLDPETGAGAYLIGGGENGGDIQVPDLVSKVMGYASTIIDLILYGAGEASNIAGQAFRLILSAFGKLFSTASNVLGWLSNIYSAITTCPIAAAALIIMSIAFLTILSILLISFVSILGGIFLGVISGIFIDNFSGRILKTCGG